MADIIDTFKVKPTGILAKWRWRRVLIDRSTFEITSECVPGQECMNLPSIDDYNKVSRAFTEGDLIQEFCNLDTFTNVRVYAQNDAPFAYAELDLNAPQCGYLTPLPQPAVPPNPFGTPSYGAYKTYEFCDKTDNYLYEITFYKKEYSGPVTAVAEAGAEPIVLRYEGEEKTDPVRGCRAIITLKSSASFSIDEFFTDDERQFLMRINRNGTLYHSGFVTPDLARRPFKSLPYDVQVTCTDGLALLKKVPFPISTGSRLNVRQSLMDALAFCLSQTGLGLEIYTAVNVYEEKMLNGPDNDPLTQCSANPLRFSDDKGNIDSCYDVLVKICNQFFAFICQVEGRWHFVRYNELSMGIVRRRLYNHTAFFLSSDQLQPLVNVSSDDDVKLINADGQLSRYPAYKSCTVFMKYGFVPSLTLNGDFELWDGANFTFWTAYGGLDFGRVQKYLQGYNGKQIPIEDYAMIFNKAANFAKYYVPTSLTINPGDKMTVTFNYGNAWVENNIFSVPNSGDNRYEVFYFRMKIGELYLHNKATTDNSPSAYMESAFEWKTGLATCSIKLGTGAKYINTYQVQFDIPPAPIDITQAGELFIQIFGFKIFDNVPLSPPIEQLNGGFVIDNFCLKKSYQYDESQILGMNFTACQDKSFTEAQEIETVLGDLDDNATLRVTAAGSSLVNPLEQTLHALFTADGSFSKRWYDLASDSEKLPINMILARSVMKAHQRASYVLDCDMLGLGLNYLNIFSICGLEGTYQTLSAEFHLKSNQMKSATLVEAFTQVLKTVNDSGPRTPRMGEIATAPDASSPPFLVLGDNDDRIFYPQFENQFI